MADDQALANVMLGMNLSVPFTPPLTRAHFSPAQEELAKRQVTPHRDDYGQARTSVLRSVLAAYEGGSVNQYLLARLDPRLSEEGSRHWGADSLPSIFMLSMSTLK